VDIIIEGQHDPAQTASVKKVAADLATAEQKFRRSKDLAEQGVLSKQAYEVDDANYKAAQATYDLAVQDVRNLQAALKEPRDRSDLAKKKLRDTTILAPFDGYITSSSTCSIREFSGFRAIAWRNLAAKSSSSTRLILSRVVMDLALMT